MSKQMGLLSPVHAVLGVASSPFFRSLVVTVLVYILLLCDVDNKVRIKPGTH